LLLITVNGRQGELAVQGWPGRTHKIKGIALKKGKSKMKNTRKDMRNAKGRAEKNKYKKA
jgi:hypothetical protein